MWRDDPEDPDTKAFLRACKRDRLMNLILWVIVFLLLIVTLTE